MAGLIAGSMRMGRQLAALALIYALLLQSLVFAFGSGRFAAAAQWPGFELCVRGGGGLDRGDIPQHPATDEHCIFCLAGVAYLLGAPHAPPFHTVAFAAVSWPFVVWRLSATTVNASTRSRGPPPAA
jgi:hypothetical protein